MQLQIGCLLTSPAIAKLDTIHSCSLTLGLRARSNGADANALTAIPENNTDVESDGSLPLVRLSADVEGASENKTISLLKCQVRVISIKIFAIKLHAALCKLQLYIEPIFGIAPLSIVIYMKSISDYWRRES